MPAFNTAPCEQGQPFSAYTIIAVGVIYLRTYRFYDSDITGHEEYDISGEQYQQFLKACFRHCATVSVLIDPDYDGNIDLWDTCRIPVSPNVQNTYCHYGVPSSEKPDRINCFEIRHYRLTAQMQKLIQSQANSLFSWTCYFGYHNPDDIAFYRPDGSVFFSSVVHEGEAALFLREDEDLSEILSQGHWIPVKPEQSL